MKTYIHNPLEICAIQWNLENAKEFEQFLGGLFYKYQCFEGGRLVIIPVQGFTMALEIGDWLIQDWNKKIFVKTNKDFIREYKEKANFDDPYLARVLKAAKDLFEDEGAAIKWLNSPARSLSYRKPLEVAVTEEGTKDVESIIGAIAHGNIL